MSKLIRTALLLLATSWVSAFVPLGTPRPSLATFSPLSASKTDSAPSLIVVSPPGGVGEVSAVKAAEQGSSVRWFVVAKNKEARQVVLAQEALDAIALAGGRVELAGADAASLLLSSDDPNSAISAVSTWCGAANAMICTLDGCAADDEGKQTKKPIEGEDPVVMWKNAVKVAAKEAARAVSGTKLTVCSAFDEEEDSEESSEGGLGGIVGSILGGGKITIPATLSQALSQDGSSVTKLRHGQLFGIPESSPDFSPLVGGPRRDPELCEEFVTRTVRVDPTMSVSGNVMMGRSTRSSRHAIGEAAALMALGKVPFASGVDVCVSSQRGTDPPSLDAWTVEFNRVQKMLASGEGAQLFAAEFTSVPKVERLADWIATKWAPAVLRTYDIATIRSGARPVYATRKDEGKVEIVWQELVNFETTVTGRMLIQVSNDGMVAVRGPGDASKGYGSVSKKPLPGEDVLVRRLAEAASQAVEKGLANRKAVAAPPPPKKEPVTATPEPAVVSSMQTSGTIVAEKPSSSTGSESGPRTAGARRSTERARGRKRKGSSSNKSISSSE